MLKTQSHNHRGNDMVGGGDKRPCKRFSKSEFTLQITFTEYIYKLYIFIYIQKKIFPKEKKNTGTVDH